jgi:predicted phosphoadenosine phosphosulfate sulfurtransferase
MKRKYNNTSVLDAARSRIEFVFDHFEKILVSFSGGKDSSVVTHMVVDEARKRGRKIGLMFVDWECQYKLTIDFVESVFKQYEDSIDPLWLCLPIKTPNETSCIDTEFVAWDETKQDIWARQMPSIAVTKERVSCFSDGMTFEEFVDGVADWYGGGKSCANFIGIRTQESLNRYRAIATSRKELFMGKYWSTKQSGRAWNFYPIYDWEKEDVWTYFGKFRKPYNPIYDRMYMAGLPLSMMRVDEPFSEQARKQLWLFSVIEPDTWSKITARIAGVHTGELYGKEQGMYGAGRISLPKGYTWKQFAHFILETMPDKTSEHYKSKIAIYLKWWSEHGYPDGIPETAKSLVERLDQVPTWRKICKTLLRNDYWCVWIGFKPTKSASYDSYIKRVREKRKEWGILVE